MAAEWQYAALASHVYGDVAEDPENFYYAPDGFSVGAPTNYGIDPQRSLSNGFFGRVYTSDDQNEVVLVMRGIDGELTDFANSAILALGITDPDPDIETQALSALLYALELKTKAEADGKVFKVIGHSLGGGLAGIISGTLDVEGYGFDPAPFQNYLSGTFYSDIILFGLSKLLKRAYAGLEDELAALEGELVGLLGDWVSGEIPPPAGSIDNTTNLFNKFNVRYMEGEFLHTLGAVGGVGLPIALSPFITRHGPRSFNVDDGSIPLLSLDPLDLHSMDLLALSIKTAGQNLGGSGGEWSARPFEGESGLMYLNSDLREVFFRQKSLIELLDSNGEPEWTGLFRVWANDLELYKANYDVIAKSASGLEFSLLNTGRAGEREVTYAIDERYLNKTLLKLGLSVIRDGIVDGVATDRAKNTWKLGDRTDLVQLDLSQINTEDRDSLVSGRPEGSNELDLWVWDTLERALYGEVDRLTGEFVEELFDGITRRQVRDGDESIGDYRFVTVQAGSTGGLEFKPAGGPDSDFNPEDAYHHGNLIIGGSERNILEGGAGNDIIFGGRGNDDFYLSPGEDIIVSGYGEDRFFVDPDALGSYTIFGENGPSNRPDLLVFGEGFEDLDITITGEPVGRMSWRGIHTEIDGVGDFTLYKVNTIALAEGINNVKLADDSGFRNLRLKYFGGDATIELIHKEVTDPPENDEPGTRLVTHEFDVASETEEGTRTFSIADGYDDELRPNDIITLDGENRLIGGVGFDFDKFDWLYSHGDRYYPFMGLDAGYHHVLEEDALEKGALNTLFAIEKVAFSLVLAGRSIAGTSPSLGMGLGLGITGTGLGLFAIAVMEYSKFINSYEDATTRRYFGLHGEEYILGAMNEDGSRKLTIIVDPQDTLEHQEFVIENWKDGDFGISIYQQGYQQGFDTQYETARDGKILVDGGDGSAIDDLGEARFSDAWIREKMLDSKHFGSLPTSSTTPLNPQPVNTLGNIQSITNLAAQTTSDNELTGLVRQGNSANNSLGGTALNDLFFGADGDDTLYGYEGRDVYVFAEGNGADTIIDTSAEGGIIRFRDGVDLAIVTFEEVAGDDGETDYLITYGVGDTILIKDWSTLDQVTKDAWIFEQLDPPEEQPSHYSEVPDRSNPTPVLEGTDGDDLLRGNDRGEVMLGYGGNDDIAGGGGADTITGGDGFDMIFGGAGRDNIRGQGGDDKLFGGVGRDTLNGGAGNDRYYFNLGDGVDTIYDEESGAPGGGIFGSPLDTDTLVFGLGIAPSDILITRDPFDAAKMVLTIGSTGEQVILADQYADEQDYGTNGIERVEFADGSIWSRKDMQDIYLSQNKTDGDDELVGTEADEIIDGGAGDDLMAGAGGDDDYIWARGDGNDRIRDVPENGQEASQNRLILGDGIVSGDVSIERPVGTSSLVLTIAGADGGTIEIDWFFGGAGKGVEKVIFADGEVWTREEIYARSVLEQITEGDDRVYGTDADDVVELGAGNDRIDSSHGDDILFGGAGDDRLGSGRILNGAGNNTFIGGTGDDRLYGGWGADTYIFSAGFGHDTLKDTRAEGAHGFENRLVFNDQTLDDFTFKATGEEGLDLLVESVDGSDSILIEKFIQHRFVSIAGEPVEIRWQSVGDFEFADGQVVSSEQIAAIAAVSGEVPNGIVGTEFSDTLIGDGERDRLVGAGGDDDISGGAGGDYLLGGEGNDTIYGGDGADLISGGAGADTIDAGEGNDLVFGSNGNDVIIAGAGDDYVSAGADNDTVSGGAGDDHLLGDGGDDTLNGGQGDDRLEGGAGADSLTGGIGNDTLIGHGGSDTYYFNYNDGRDVIEAATGRVAGDVETLVLGAGMTLDIMRPIFNGRDLIINFANGTADQLTLKGFLGSGELSEIQFDDGTSMTGQQLLAWVVGASVGDDPVAAAISAQNDTLKIQYGGKGDDFLASLTSHTYYVFGRGDGNDQMYAREGSSFLGQPFVHLLIVRDYRSDEVVLSRYGADGNHLLISFTTGDDTMIVINHFGSAGPYYDDRIDNIRFADDVIWSETKIAQVVAAAGGVGSSLDEVLESTAGDDVLAGGEGSDTYVYTLGDGSDTIVEDSDADATDVLALGADIAPQSITVSRNGDDLILTLSDGETITLTGQLTGDGIEQVTFENGDVWDRGDLISQLASSMASTGDDILTGFDGDETLNGGAGDDTLAGGAGGDTYTYALGDGSDTILEEVVEGHDRLVFDGSIDSQATVLRRDPNAPDDMLVELEDGATIRITGQFSDGGVEEIRFADGTFISRDVIEFKALQGSQSDGDDVIIGTDQLDIIAAGTGNDLIDGGGGTDIYSYASGDGMDRIADSGAGAEDTVVFQNGIASQDLVLARDGDDLMITFDGTPGDALAVEGHFSGHALSGILFADGTFWATDEITHRAETGLPPADGGSDPVIVPPTGPLQPQSATEDEAFAYDVPADVFADLGAVTVTMDGGALPSWLNYSSGQFSGMPSADDAGVLKLVLSGTDTDGNAITETLFVGVTPVNDAPIANGSVADIEVFESVEINVDLSTSDITDEDDALLYKTIEMADGSELPSWLIFDAETMILGGTPPKSTVTGSDKTTTFALRLVAEDDAGLGVSLDFELAVHAGDPTRVYEGTDGNDSLKGNSSSAVFIGGLGDDILYGNGGSNIFIFNQGDGNDYIQRSYSTSSTKNSVGGTVRFGEGITPDDLILERGDGNTIHTDSLLISFVGTPGDRVWINEQFGEMFGGATTVTRIEFADGTVWSQEDIYDMMPQYPGEVLGDGTDNLLIGSAADEVLSGGYGDDTLDGAGGNDLLYGGDGDDTLDGGSGTDILDGGTGDDTYLFGYGSGNNQIIDKRGDSGAIPGLDTLLFGEGITLADLTFEISDLGYNWLSSEPMRMALTIGLQGAPGDTVTLSDQYFFQIGRSSGIDFFKFDDGTVLTIQELDAYIVGDGVRLGTSGEDTIVGTTFGERIIGGAGDDELQGGLGDDTYVWAPGDGNDTITERDDRTFDILELGGGITADDVVLRRGSTTHNENDLYVDILTTGESILIDRQYQVSFEEFDPGSAEERFWLVPVIDEIRFSDGTAWNYDYLRNIFLTGTSADQELHGYEFQDDILDGKGGDDALFGYGGDDVYIFGRGYGHDLITDPGPINIHEDDVNTIRFIGDITAEDINVDLVDGVDYFNRPQKHYRFTIRDTGESITINGKLTGLDMVFQVEFESTGEIWDAQGIIGVLRASYSTSGDDVFTGGGTMDLGEGNDTFIITSAGHFTGGNGSDTYDDGETITELAYIYDFGQPSRRNKSASRR